MTTDAPERVWTEDRPVLSDHVWIRSCSSKQFESYDVEYVRADLYNSLKDALLTLRMSLDGDDWIGKESMYDFIDRHVSQR